MAIATTPPRHWPPSGTAAVRPRRASRLLEYFVLLEIITQLALLSSTLATFRRFFRFAAFGVSLALLLVLPGNGKQHPAAKAALLVMVILGLSMVNPGINSSTAAAAQFAIYLAVLAPLFWVSRIRIDPAEMRRVIFLQWAFQFASSIVGVLQVYFPARFQFNISSVVAQGGGAGYLAMQQFLNAHGETVYRPMGLTDTPGGASAAGFYTVLFAAAFFLLERRRWVRIVCAA